MLNRRDDEARLIRLRIMRAQDRLAQARRELALADEEARHGNERVARMIAASVRGKVALAEEALTGQYNPAAHERRYERVTAYADFQAKG